MCQRDDYPQFGKKYAQKEGCPDFFFLLVKKYFGIKPDLIQDHEKKLFQNANAIFFSERFILYLYRHIVYSKCAFHNVFSQNVFFSKMPGDEKLFVASISSWSKTALIFSMIEK